MDYQTFNNLRRDVTTFMNALAFSNVKEAILANELSQEQYEELITLIQSRGFQISAKNIVSTTLDTTKIGDWTLTTLGQIVDGEGSGETA